MLFITLAAVPLSLAACDKSEADADTNEPAASNGEKNLCAEYSNCNACISGEQQEGMTEGEAETACGLAVTGCWTTWDKPVKCGSDTYEEQPS